MNTGCVCQALCAPPPRRRGRRRWASVYAVSVWAISPAAWVAEGSPLSWPPQPADPRVVYVRSLSTPSDFGAGGSWFGRAMDFITGTKDVDNGLGRPFGIAFDEHGGLCITDTGDNTVWFLPGGKRRSRHWEGVGTRRFLSPVGIAKRNGTIYVADSRLAEVIAFTEDGALLFELGEPLVQPVGLAIDGDRLYVADAQAHCIVCFTLKGVLVSRFGSRGDGPGEFNFPTHVAAHRGMLYVTDAMNARVQVIGSDGVYRGEIGGRGDGSGHFSRPKGVAVDGEGHVYVVDALFDNVQIFAPEGAFLLNIGRAGAGAGEFWMPAGIAIDKDNRIAVADSYNRRIQVLKYVGVAP